MAEELREQLEGHAAITVMNGENFGPVTLFRVYPDGVDTFSMPQQERTDPAMRATLRTHNAYNRRIFERIQLDALQGRGVVISMTDCYRESDDGEPIVALKSYILSPFSEDAHVAAVLESIWQARRDVAAEPSRG
jgi:L-2,4-diaminobutyrate decarboxylase